MQRQFSTEGDPASAHEFRRAKVEHYLDRAQEYIAMGRLLAAKKPLEHVSLLDPGNSIGRGLLKSIEDAFTSMRDSAPAQERPGLPDTGGRKARRAEVIMVVDQDERLLMRLTQSLRRFGFRSVAAGGYREAAELLSFLTPHLIISEVNFENGPVGFDLYLMVRTTARLHDVPFLFLATRVDRETLIAGKRLGVNDFIIKPLDDEVVHASIMSSLTHSRQPAATQPILK